MFGFCTEVHFWTTCDDIIISDLDYLTFKFLTKKGSTLSSSSSIFEQHKQLYGQKRGLRCFSNKKLPEKLKDNTRELDTQLKSSILIRYFWKSSDHIILVFQNGLLVNIVIDLESGRIEQIIFDKFLIKNLQNEYLFDVIFLENHLICISNNNHITIVHFTRNSLSTFQEIKIKKLEPIVKNVQLSSLMNRRLEKQIVPNEAGTLVMIWWRNSRLDMHPWSPNVRDEDRANIYLYNLSGCRMDFYGFYCTEFDIVYVQFSKSIPDIIFCVERRSEMTIDLAVLKFQIGAKLQKVSSISLEVDGEISTLAFSPDEDKLLLCSCNRLLLIYDRLSGKVTTTKSIFVPVLASWHSSSTFFNILSDTGQIQCFDLVLSNITVNCNQEDATILDLAKFFKSKSYNIVDASWNKKLTKLNTLKYKYKPLDSYFLLNFEKGPLVLIKFIGVVNHIDETFSADMLVNSYLKENDIENAIKVLINLNWSSNPVVCLASLQYIFNMLAKKRLTPKIEDQLEKVLSTFYTTSINNETKDNFKDQIQDLNRRFFHHLLRFGNLDKAYAVATIVNHRDLFMDLFYFAMKIGKTDFAINAKMKAFEIFRSDKNIGPSLPKPAIKMPVMNNNQSDVPQDPKPMGKESSNVKVVHFGLI